MLLPLTKERMTNTKKTIFAFCTRISHNGDRAHMHPSEVHCGKTCLAERFYCIVLLLTTCTCMCEWVSLNVDHVTVATKGCSVSRGGVASAERERNGKERKRKKRRNIMKHLMKGCRRGTEGERTGNNGRAESQHARSAEISQLSETIN